MNSSQMFYRNLPIVPFVTGMKPGSHFRNNKPSIALCINKSNSLPTRTLATKSLNQSLELFTNSNEPITLTGNGQFQLTINEERPLTIILPWLMSQRKHIYKYAKYYLDNGFDVLTVRTTPWQLLWPATGSHVVANDLLTFLHQNPNYYKSVIHGFSVGAYLWGEVMVKMSQDTTKYAPAMNRICGQIWDSPVDYAEIPIGVPKSVFPRNEFLRKSLQRYIEFHMKYQHSSTKHHLKATDQFYNTIINAPAMFLFSLKDPMVSLKSIETCSKAWQEKGLSVNWRAWEQPPHVGIFQRHPDEYQDEIRIFLEKHIFAQNHSGTQRMKEAMAS